MRLLCRTSEVPKCRIAFCGLRKGKTTTLLIMRGKKKKGERGEGERAYHFEDLSRGARKRGYS